MNVIERNPVTSITVVVLALLLLYGTVWVGGSYFEARAYNHATRSNVSTWDAMWLDLRVQATPKE
jgi:hypothetical protein